MINVLSTNITSPLGLTTEQNYRAVLSGASALRRYGPKAGEDRGPWGTTEPFAASLFSEAQRAEFVIDGHTFFEALAIRSVREALSHTKLDISSPRVVLILSTTKGNIGQPVRYYPSEAATEIAKTLGVTTTPIVVCNACVSGLSAQLLADRLLSQGIYDYAIVVGAEVQGLFIVSGFQALKAVSEDPCRPFDMERNGLNPGEAAATIVFAKTADGQGWWLADGAAQGDAYHIVSPSPGAEGLTAAIEAVMKGRDKGQLGAVCVHGTATLYNDQMESKAIQKAGLTDVPLSALKGNYGHTMGAAGVLETILSMRAADAGTVLPTKGFTELGVRGKVSISDAPQLTDKTAFLKIMSGFGGCNVAALYQKQAVPPTPFRGSTRPWTKVRTVKLCSKDGQTLTDIYRQEIGNYPKFHKMDILSRLAFVVAERLLKASSQEAETGEGQGSEVDVILFNHSSSVVADRQYLATICEDAESFIPLSRERFFPSPAAFVYTLPNIAASEVAIRHHLHGETSFYILPERDEALMQQILEATLAKTNMRTAISGWVDAESETNYECELSIYKTTS
ncbi:MAG: 3-oxoacyl-ACP synthase [Bacteroidaceae bacterium]|nr:3-oxoacyl-ACP synthase [Bacteroidaceae bacterium]